jgi:hypothetical protein
MNRLFWALAIGLFVIFLHPGNVAKSADTIEIPNVSADGASIVVKPGNGSKAIQQAIDQVSLRGGGVIHLLPGKYICDGPIIIRSKNISIIGSGKRLTELQFTGTDGIHLDGSGGSIRYCVLESFFIQGKNAKGSGLKLTASVENTFRNLFISGFLEPGKYGLEYSGNGGDNFYNQFTGCTFAGNSTGAMNIGQVNQYYNCRFQGNKENGLVDFGTAPTFLGCGFEGNGLYGVETSHKGGKSFLGCYWEKNGKAGLFCKQTEGLLISGGRVYTGAKPSEVGLIIGRASGNVPNGVVIQGMLFYGPHITAAIDLVGVNNVSVVGNSFINEVTKIRVGRITGERIIQNN